MASRPALCAQANTGFANKQVKLIKPFKRKAAQCGFSPCVRFGHAECTAWPCPPAFRSYPQATSLSSVGRCN
nr:MAG TPA_asm: hypothetical protein [Caudoviricetes sp.]